MMAGGPQLRTSKAKFAFVWDWSVICIGARAGVVACVEG